VRSQLSGNLINQATRRQTPDAGTKPHFLN
jgi:hypothetical protein